MKPLKKIDAESVLNEILGTFDVDREQLIKFTDKLTQSCFNSYNDMDAVIKFAKRIEDQLYGIHQLALKANKGEKISITIRSNITEDKIEVSPELVLMMLNSLPKGQQYKQGAGTPGKPMRTTFLKHWVPESIEFLNKHTTVEHKKDKLYFAGLCLSLTGLIPINKEDENPIDYRNNISDILKHYL